MKNCPVCGQEINDDAGFCPNCGAQLQEQKAEDQAPAGPAYDGEQAVTPDAVPAQDNAEPSDTRPDGKNSSIRGLLIAVIVLLSVAIVGAVLLWVWPGFLNDNNRNQSQAAAAPAATQDPATVLLTINGTEVTLGQAREMFNYYVDLYGNQGYDMEDEENLAVIRAFSTRQLIWSTLIDQYAAEHGLDRLTEEEEAQIAAENDEMWEDAIAGYIEYYSGAATLSGMGDDEAAALRANAVAYYEAAGFTRESTLADQREAYITERVKAEVLAGEDIEVTDEDIAAYHAELAEEDRQLLYGDQGGYEMTPSEIYAMYGYFGYTLYYIPEGFRTVKHILLEVDEDVLDAYLSVAARWEEQAEEAETADDAAATAAGEDTAATVTGADAAATAAGEDPAVTAPGADVTATVTGEDGTAAGEDDAPVTYEQVEAARQAVIESVREQLDAIYAALESGVSFDDLIAEYGTDPGMAEEPAKTDGYMVSRDSYEYDPDFVTGAFSIAEPGEISDPVVTRYGVHLILYVREVPAGPVEMTQAMHDEYLEQLTAEAEDEAFTAVVEHWIAESDIVYTEAGQPWRTDILDAE